ncbi:hypothetical protein [Rhizobium mongolense]|uniref:Uncharacterized protein n=2 Tax=Rhizobium mongolense TaxID=57676 RepID=A0ABR6IQZ6_9HYPH|nr:hypothetical protein [Rhizobium mongolense]MBB4230028.1 hypothetical protein [Rhizobium mongolense]TVZ72840.1 hypothetical protein BCL32_1027 [Rhizobium mongolense USDA 1844]
MVIDSVLGPWRPDVPVLNNPGVTVARNVLPAIGALNGAIAYEPMKRTLLYSNASLPSRPLGAISGQDLAGNGKVYAGCSEGLFKVSPSELSWQDVSRSTPYTPGTEKWNFTKYGSWAIGTNFVNPPQYIDMNEDEEFQDLTPLLKARYGTASRGFVIFANTNDSFDGDVPYRVRWSGLDQPKSWDFSQTTQADFQDINGGSGVIQGIVGGEDVTIFMKDSIVKMTYVGTPLIWQFDEVVQGKGCAVPESIITVGRTTYFLGKDGFYAWDGGLTRIGEGKIDNYFLKSVNTDQYTYMSVAADPAKPLIYWLYSSTNAIDGTPDKMLVYNYSIGEFTEVEAEIDFIFNSVSQPWTIAQLDQYFTIAGMPAPWDSPTWAGGNAQLAGMNVSGAIYLFTGENQTGTIETSEQFLIQQMIQINPDIKGDRSIVTRVRPMIDGNGSVTARVGSRLLSQGDLTWSQMTARNETGWCIIRQQGRFHRVRLVLTGNYTQATSLQYDAVPAGFR